MKMNLPGVHGGISQQSPHLRLLNQHTSSSNVLFDVIHGIKAPRWGTSQVRSWNIGQVLGTHQTSDGNWWVVHLLSDELLITPVDSGLPQSNLSVALGTYLSGTSYDLLGILDTIVLTNRSIEVEPVLDTDVSGQNVKAMVYIPQVFEDLSTDQYTVILKTNKVTTLVPTLSEIELRLNSALTVGALDTPTSVIDSIAEALNMGSYHFFCNSAGALLYIGFHSAEVEHGGNLYRCILSHTSAAGNAPGVSATHWQDLGAAATPPERPAWDPAKKFYTSSDLQAARPSFTLNFGNPEFTIRTYGTKALDPDPLDTTGDIRIVTTSVSYEALPPSISPLFISIIQLSPGYFVKFDAESNTYVEATAVAQRHRLNKLTMPHELRYDPATNLWSAVAVDELDDLYRRVGDAVSAPMPDFVGRKIQGAFFHRNRLGFLSDNFVALSKTSAYWDFFPSTATEVLDDDPISVFPSSTDYDPLLWAIPFNKQLFVVGLRKQYVLHSGYDALGPATIAMDEATAYRVKPFVRPLNLEASMVLPLDHGDYIGALEYHLGEQEIAMEGSLLSSHVPEYIPGDITGMAYAPSQKLLLFFKGKQVWVYKSHKNQQGELMQAAWSSWELPEEIKGIISPTGNQLYLLGETTCMLMTIDSQGISLDNSREAAAGAVLSFAADELVISKDTLKILEVANGSVAAEAVHLGKPVDWELQLSPLILRDDKGLPRQDVRVKIYSVAFDWIGGSFSLQSSGINLPTKSKLMVPLTYTESEIAAGASYLEPSRVNFLCMSPAPRTQLVLSGSDYLPVEINNVCFTLDVEEDI